MSHETSYLSNGYLVTNFGLPSKDSCMNGTIATRRGYAWNDHQPKLPTG